MELEKLTQKSREALAAAQSTAAQHGHTEVDAEHLAHALLAQESGLATRLFEKMGVPVEPFRKRLEQELERRPRVSGPGREAGKVYVTGRLEQVLVRAQEATKRSRTSTSRSSTWCSRLLAEPATSGSARCSQSSASRTTGS